MILSETYVRTPGVQEKDRTNADTRSREETIKALPGPGHSGKIQE